MRADDAAMNITRTLMSLSVLAATGVGVLAASPSVSAQEKVCIHRSLQLRNHVSDGDTEYFYFEDVCDGWMDVGSREEEPPKEGGSGRPGTPMTKEEECEALAARLNEMEVALRWADDNVLALEAAVGAFDREETNAGRAEADAAADALAADVALATAEARYYAAGYDTTRLRIVNRTQIEEYIGFDISTREGKAVVAAQAAQQAAQAKLRAARDANGASHTNGLAEGDTRRNLDDARSILATYPMLIEQLRREFQEDC